jgi:hypothetical protein
MQIINDERNRSHPEHDGLGRTNISQRSLGFSLILLDKDWSHMLEHKHCSVSKRKALARSDDSDAPLDEEKALVFSPISWARPLRVAHIVVVIPL